MEYLPATRTVIDHIAEHYGVDPEFLWARTPGNAAFRHHGDKKWFAALLLNLPRKTLGLGEAGHVDVLNLKCDPATIGALLDGARFLPGYHMNKEHWISLVLDGSIPAEEVFQLIEYSYHLTGRKPRCRPAAEKQGP